MTLAHQNIMITGANRGIGLAFAKAVIQASQQTCHLTLVIRVEDKDLKEELVQLGAKNVDVILADLSLIADIARVAEEIKSRRIDVLFNNAGLLTGGLFEQQPIESIHQMLTVNVNALIHLSQAVLPQMLQRKSGLIINHGSVSSIMHLPCASTYSASKAAVWAFTDCLEQELKGTGVSTLCLLTPGVKTRMFAQIDELYSNNIKVPQDSISPDKYALQIIQAIQNNARVLTPGGSTGVGLFLAQHWRAGFNWASRKVFKRE